MTTLSIPIRTDVLVLNVEEVKSLLDELSHTYVNKENETYVCVINKMSDFLSRQDKENAGQNKDN